LSLFHLTKIHSLSRFYWTFFREDTVEEIMKSLSYINFSYFDFFHLSFWCVTSFSTTKKKHFCASGALFSSPTLRFFYSQSSMWSDWFIHVHFCFWQSSFSFLFCWRPAPTSHTHTFFVAKSIFLASWYSVLLTSFSTQIISCPKMAPKNNHFPNWAK
jgi:hypothetical protein